MSNWKAQTAQVVLFPVVPGGAPMESAIEMYKVAWQTDPDSFQKQVAGSPFAMSMAQGTIERLSATCVVQPIRIDFTLAPPQQSTIATMIPLIYESKAFHAQVTHILNALGDFQTGPPVNRVSCVIKFAAIAPNHVEANKLISATLPKQYRAVLSDEQEFVLQVDLVRPNKTLSEIRMNFLTKWSVERAQLITFTTFQPPNAVAGQPSQMVQEFIMPNITFDNNNIQLPRPMTRQDRKAVFVDCLENISMQLKEYGIAIEGF